ncbi:MAG: tRNA uridine-5-carboxymethylaminomethyl(34) synthesis GTPase MnmE [Bacteroidales bacterium]|nr:tRNA uridine-5-carboxymethylaminomethyl(34) synthesis GTPase MnmE [Bacteroidales bacterium]
MHFLSPSTICAIATARGSGAIAVIRMSGSETFSIIEKVFRPIQKGIQLSQQKGNTVWYGEIWDDQTLIDEVLVTVFKAPKSYTGEDSIEISCHASTYIQQKIMQLLVKNGADLASPGAFTQRAFANGKMDLAQAESVADLIASESRAMHQVAINQLKGTFSRELQALRKEMIRFASLLELELDFSEEDVEFANRTELLKALNKLQSFVQGLIASFDYGNAIKNGVSVAIVGQPNVGKSTLLNRLLKDDKAIVSDIPGTTRDAIEDTINIEGILFRFIDTAGIRETKDHIENLGIDIAKKKLQKAQVVIWMLDVTQSIKENLKWLNETGRHAGENVKQIVVLNKADQLSDEEQKKINAELNFDINSILLSAKGNLNIDKLERTLVELIQSNYNQQTVVVSNLRHLEALSDAKLALERAEQGLINQMPTDLLAMDVRQANHHIGSITGEITHDDLLGYIFANFCIGK